MNLKKLNNNNLIDNYKIIEHEIPMSKDMGLSNCNLKL